MKVIYIAGFRQHAGKTLTSLGIISQLLNYFKADEIGYIKPVGQELVKLPDGTKIDKDAIILQQFALPDIDMRYVSPVRLGNGVTKEYLRSSDKNEYTARFEQSIQDALLSFKDKKVVIAEGTGHPGVGGIVNLSNSRVSQLIDAQVLYLAGGGIGRTLDMLEVDMTYFHKTGAKVRGVVFNKLIPDKIDQMKECITEELLTERFSTGAPIDIMGFIPAVERLNNPSMSLVYTKFPNAIAAGEITNPEWNMPCGGVAIISQSHENFIPAESINKGDIIIISSYSERRLMKILHYNDSLPEHDKIAGIIFTCTKVGIPLKDSIKAVVANRVPAIYVAEDTSSADEKLYKCIKNTKLQEYDFEKYEHIKKLFADNFDTEKFMSSFGIQN